MAKVWQSLFGRKPSEERLSPNEWATWFDRPWTAVLDGTVRSSPSTSGTSSVCPAARSVASSGFSAFVG